MTSHELLEQEVARHLNGNRERVAELFTDRSLLDRLASLTQPHDERSYAKGLSDGWYFVANGPYFDVYYQERGAFVPCFHRFESPKEAAIMFFAVTRYTKRVRNFSRGKIFNAQGEIPVKAESRFFKRLGAGLVGLLGALFLLIGAFMLYFTFGEPNTLVACVFLIGVGAACLLGSVRTLRKG